MDPYMGIYIDFVSFHQYELIYIFLIYVQILEKKSKFNLFAGDLCEPNPCGVHAVCTPGHDNTGKERPVCTCPTGYIGNALVSCQRGECQTDSECPDNKACINYTCENPCSGKQCGTSATCTPRHHVAVCTCPEGTRGDALYSCDPINSRAAYGRFRY